jgi:hypothetical protein
MGFHTCCLEGDVGLELCIYIRCVLVMITVRVPHFAEF